MFKLALFLGFIHFNILSNTIATCFVDQRVMLAKETAYLSHESNFTIDEEEISFILNFLTTEKNVEYFKSNFYKSKKIDNGNASLSYSSLENPKNKTVSLSFIFIFTPEETRISANIRYNTKVESIFYDNIRVSGQGSFYIKNLDNFLSLEKITFQTLTSDINIVCLNPFYNDKIVEY